ncbi:C-factor [Orchesella cincta]|uniref:C-factor n=1 Tax=Orchesella cincta TaxID=48709 RepID=A0A1D2NHT4_ORCCI|nr:C-factor [Orchesella cincta]
MSNLLGRRVLITGTSRGLGLEMVKQLLKRHNPEKIFATCRNPDQATQLKEIAAIDSRVHLLKIDVNDVASFLSAKKEVENLTNGEGIHVLINNAGIFSSGGQSLEDVSKELMLEFYNVNTLGPILLVQAFLPLLLKGNNATEKMPGLIVNFSSRLGSISDNSSGGYYASRCCRAAMNAATKSMSIDLRDKRIIVVGMNPGWVKTDQGGDEAPLSPEDSVAGILKVLDKVNGDQAGNLLQHDGKIVEW